MSGRLNSRLTSVDIQSRPRKNADDGSYYSHIAGVVLNEMLRRIRNKILINRKHVETSVFVIISNKRH